MAGNAGDGVACHGMMGVRRSRICPSPSRKSWRYGVLLWKLSRSVARCRLIGSKWGSRNGDAVSFLIGAARTRRTDPRLLRVRLGRWQAEWFGCKTVISDCMEMRNRRKLGTLRHSSMRGSYSITSRRGQGVFRGARDEFRDTDIEESTFLF